jgi:WD40 repeat protein
VGVAGNAEAEAGVYLYDTTTWEIVHQWTLQEPGMTINSLFFSPDSEMVAVVCSQTGVCLRDVTTGEVVRQLENSTFARDAAFSPDGAYLAVVGGSYLQVYEVATGEMLYRQTVMAEDNSYLRVAFSPDGSQIATANTLDLLLFEMP